MIVVFGSMYIFMLCHLCRHQVKLSTQQTYPFSPESVLPPLSSPHRSVLTCVHVALKPFFHSKANSEITDIDFSKAEVSHHHHMHAPKR